MRRCSRAILSMTYDARIRCSIPDLYAACFGHRLRQTTASCSITPSVLSTDDFNCVRGPHLFPRPPPVSYAAPAGLGVRRSWMVKGCDGRALPFVYHRLR